LWYRNWHDGNANSERRDRALASIREQARAAADETARALGTSGATDTDTLISVIWRHTQAPVITYEASRREFTATAETSAQYDHEVVLPGSGPVEVTRCYIITYTHHPGRAWTSRVSERDHDVCRPGVEIGGLARLAQTRISSMYAQDLTHSGVQKALNPTGRRSFEVKSVAREGDTTTVSVVVSSSGAAVDQCYDFTRHAPGGDGRSSATAVPTASC
jgi:hypothetical protein